MSEQWVTRWRLEVSPKPVLPGIWKVRGGGFVASAQVRDPMDRPEPGRRTRYKTAFAVLRDAQTAKEALDWLTAAKRRILDAAFDPFEKQIPRWKDFAVFVLERKVAAGDLQSEATVQGWKANITKRLRKRYPRWYAFTLLGFVLGLKPSLLRPLRRRGPDADIDLGRKKIYIRRSHTKGEQVLDAAKSGGTRELLLPDELIDVLRDHIKKIDASPMGPKTDLLFPSAFTGKMLSTGCLTISWRAIAKEMGLTKRVSPRAMSRTFQQIADEAKTNARAAMVVGWHKSRRARPEHARNPDDEVSAALVRLICVGTASRVEKS